VIRNWPLAPIGIAFDLHEAGSSIPGDFFRISHPGDRFAPAVNNPFQQTERDMDLTLAGQYVT
jgi:hypothetical protein